jgi:hypothetical protein
VAERDRPRPSEATFREHEIDAKVLPELTEADLDVRRSVRALQPGPAARSAPPRALRSDARRRLIAIMFCHFVGLGDRATRASPLTLQQSLATRLDRLGEAREVAQVGAVLGRDFAYALVREVAERGEAQLQAGLERLAEADIRFIEGLPPKAKYRFKHAPTQDAACYWRLKAGRNFITAESRRHWSRSFSKWRRRSRNCSLPYTEAGLNETAIDYWRKAGELAAIMEAIELLPRGLAYLIEALPDRQFEGGAGAH